MLKDDVEKFQSRFSWLKDSRFVQELESDSVDSELLEEELSALQEEEILTQQSFVAFRETSRQKLVKYLNSNPVQILLCVVVLLDAGIVIAQILLDLHSVRAKLHRREDDLVRLVEYIRDNNADALHGYEGNDVSNILQILQEQDRSPEWDGGGDSEKGDRTKHGNATHHARHKAHRSRGHAKREGHKYGDIRLDNGDNNNKHHRHRADPGYTGTGTHRGRHGDGRAMQGVGETQGGKEEEGAWGQPAAGPVSVVEGRSADGSCPGCARSSRMYQEKSGDGRKRYHVEQEEHDTLHEVAHGLHFASLALLGFLVLEDFVKIFAMGKEFFRHKIEIFDAIIIVASFIFDIIFLGGVMGEEGEKAAAVLVVLLLWRITRVIDGILITTKQRQEFRIRLQKRARRKAEKRVDLLEEDKHVRIRQVAALKELCMKAGLTDDDIEACTPRRPRRVSNTMCALSSVARLSVSMTMSMSSGLFSMADDDTDKSDDNKDSGRSSDSLRLRDDHHVYLDLTRLPERRHSLTTTPPGKMSDIEEESSSQREDDLSPVNCSGIQIIIDEGSESPSPEEIPSRHLHSHSEPGSPDRLCPDGSTDRRQSRLSQLSQVHLLS